MKLNSEEVLFGSPKASSERRSTLTSHLQLKQSTVLEALEQSQFCQYCHSVVRVTLSKSDDLDSIGYVPQSLL